ncbi:uncharacterized protein N7496_001240 [Penicillium cataractarum]|uniref:Uncharacterized protein n=1 Tax=Penicillium cataractarum TaxID=2100454 RepID=A0A9X0B6W1_9EURO|nr:uncharacterized protein N7496_001240 [Penicillium cataractarum]KAJ5390172.1 hypothetical protein N7496_001240 [Penicillium cataractarum]
MAEFLFIDYQDDQLQNLSLQRRKREFTQKARYRKERLAAMGRLKSSTLVLRHRLPLAYVPLGLDGAELGPTTKSRPDGGPSGTDTPEPEAPQIIPVVNFGSPRRLSGDGFVDPFATTAFPMTGSMNSFFHQLRHFTIPGAYPVEQSRMTVWWWQQGTSQPAIAGNVEAATAHTKGVEALIELNGGVEALDHMAQSEIYHGDMLNAILTNTRPTLSPTATWRSKILQEEKIFHSTSNFITGFANQFKKDLSQLSCLGTSFFAAPWYSGLEDSMKDLLQWSQRLIQYYEIARLQTSITTQSDNDLFLVLEHQLMLIRYTPKLSASYTISDLLNEPLRVTLLIYLNACVWHFRVFPIMRYMVSPLQQILLSNTTGANSILHCIKRNAPDLLFWILFIGGVASRGHHEHLWFVAQLVELTSYLGISDWDAAQVILRGFFHMDHPGQPGGKELWEEVSASS